MPPVMDAAAPKVSARLLALQLFGAWVLLQIGVMLAHPIPVLDGKLLDTDAYMRMVRVAELLAGEGWYDSQIARSNAPFGEELHWTRPFDLLLILGALPLAPFLGWKPALFWAGAAVSPLLQLAAAFAFAWAVRPLVRPGQWFLPAIAFLVLPAALSYALPGRADHHLLLALVFVLQWGLLVRAVAAGRAIASAAGAGALTGLGLWLSVELLLSAVACLAALALAWLLDPAGRRRQNLCFAAAFTAALTLALLAEHPLAQVSTMALDKVSLAHLLIAAAALLFWVLVAVAATRWPSLETGAAGRRLLAGLAGGVAALALIHILAPGFFAGPMADIDPRIVPIWHDKVTEMKDMVPRDRKSLGDLILYLGHLAFALPFLIWRLWRGPGGSDRLAWLAVALGVGVYALAAVLHVRFAALAEILILFALAGLLDHTLAATGRVRSDVWRGLSRGLIIALLLVGPTIIGTAVGSTRTFRAVSSEPVGKTAAMVCDIKGVSEHLASEAFRAGSGPATILAFMDLGPELLYRTPHRVIGTPYHRNGAGIADGHRMLAGEDDEEARRLMAARAVDYVLLCPNSAERVFYTRPGSTTRLYDRLVAGQPPSWLTPVALPGRLSGGFKLFRTRL